MKAKNKVKKGEQRGHRCSPFFHLVFTFFTSHLFAPCFHLLFTLFSACFHLVFTLFQSLFTLFSSFAIFVHDVFTFFVHNVFTFCSPWFHLLFTLFSLFLEFTLQNANLQQPSLRALVPIVSRQTPAGARFSLFAHLFFCSLFTFFHLFHIAKFTSFLPLDNIISINLPTSSIKRCF